MNPKHGQLDFYLHRSAQCILGGAGLQHENAAENLTIDFVTIQKQGIINFTAQKQISDHYKWKSRESWPTAFPIDFDFRGKHA